MNKLENLRLAAANFGLSPEDVVKGWYQNQYVRREFLQELLSNTEAEAEKIKPGMFYYAGDRSFSSGLIAGKQVSAIVGSMYSAYCIAAMPSVAEVGMPYLSMGGSVGVSEEQNPYTWQVRPLDSALGVILADFAVNTLGCSKPAIMHSTQSTFASEAEHLIAAFEENGVEITDENVFGFPEEESNYSPYISQIMSGDFDCVIALANQAPAAIICQQVQAAGLTSDMMPLIGSASFCSALTDAASSSKPKTRVRTKVIAAPIPTEIKA